MKIKITGFNGYIGQLLMKALTEKGHQVSGIKREIFSQAVSVLEGEIKGSDVIINLAGASVLRRWTQKNKKLIYDSRIETTKKLVIAINNLGPDRQPKKFISASAIGIYKSGYSHDESSKIFDAAFLGKLVYEWENTLEQLPSSIQTTIFRIGPVLGKKAKTIKNLLTPFKLGLGGRIGTGKQAFPFIHEYDLVNAFVWAVETAQENQIFNLVAPQQITNSEFTKALATKLKRPAVIPIPELLIRLILGEASFLLLESPIVIPRNILDSGFSYKYATIDSALSEILA